jgi:hypothetical protein
MTEIINTSEHHIIDGQKLIFDNVYGELEFYKKKCDSLEKDIFKYQTLNKKLEISNKKLQDVYNFNGKVNFYNIE